VPKDGTAHCTLARTVERFKNGNDNLKKKLPPNYLYPIRASDSQTYYSHFSESTKLCKKQQIQKYQKAGTTVKCFAHE
jgi:hypothetical protein